MTTVEQPRAGRSRAGTTDVVYVGGTGRSGSTVLANVVGELDGYVSVGELRFLWERGILQDRLCGCGRAFSACPWWAEVLDLALGPGSPQERQALARRLQAELGARLRLRTLPGHLASHRAHVSLRRDGELEDVLGRLYAAISTVAGGAVVVDSSKLPTYAVLLAGMESVDPRVLHLVRDPRAAAYSWQRRTAQPDRGPGAQMERRSPWRSAALWAVWNRSLELLADDLAGRYVRVCYEDFVAAPAATLRDALSCLGLPADVDGVVTDGGVRLSPNHTVAGNPARHRAGLVPLVLDDEWSRSMPALERRAVTAVTWPVLRRYGYGRR